MAKWQRFLFVPVCIVLLIVGIAFLPGSLPGLAKTSSSVLPGGPSFLPYQGVMTNPAGTPLSGSFEMQFSIYDTPTGGTPLWSESQTVALNYGLFNVNLGEFTSLPASLFTNLELYLGIRVGADEEMSPRLRFGSSAFAFSAQQSACTLDVWYYDGDGDNFGTNLQDKIDCNQPVGFASAGGDCDDGNPGIFPGANEVCNGLNDDCDAEIDEGNLCDDGKWCTIDSCDGVFGCSYVSTCDDGFACTIDTCDGNGCLFLPENSYCDDANSCTTDICDPTQGGCTHTALPDGTICDDYGEQGICQSGYCDTGN